MPPAAQGAHSRGWRGSDVAALAAVTAVALAIRLAGIGRESLWIDEGVSAYVARLAPGDIVAWVRGDVHSPLYYLLLHAWRAAFGGSEAALRSLSAVGSALTVPVMFSLARRAGARPLECWVVAVGAFVLGTFPLRFAQEARSYALLAFATALSWDRLLAARASGGLARWALYAAATSLAVGIHHYGALAVLAQGIHVGLAAGGRDGRRRFGAWLVALFAAGLPLLPWVATLRSQVNRVLVGGEFWVAPPVLMDLVRTAWEFAGSWVLLALLAGTAAFALVRAARAGAAPAARDATLAMALWAVVPVLAAFSISHAWHPIYIVRGLLSSALPLYVMAAAGASMLPRPWRAATLAVFGPALLLAYAGYLHGPHKDPWREAAGLVEARAQAGDVVLVSAPWNKRYAWDFYARRGDLDVEAFPGAAQPAAQAESARIAAGLAGRSGVWAVLSRSGNPAAVLAAGAAGSRRAVLDTALLIRPTWLSRRPLVLGIRVVHYRALSRLPRMVSGGHSAPL